jgi:hypothetical protein
MHGTWALAVAPIALQLNSQAAETKKPQLQSNYGFYFGGLGRNRTTDTRIFNSVKPCKTCWKLHLIVIRSVSCVQHRDCTVRCKRVLTIANRSFLICVQRQ